MNALEQIRTGSDRLSDPGLKSVLCDRDIDVITLSFIDQAGRDRFGVMDPSLIFTFAACIPADVISSQQIG
jgi:hypothetical protein